MAQRIFNYEFRPQQLQMALDICDVLLGDSVFLAEAGTGTGKSLAYLLPAALMKKKVIISTGTKNLQEQLFFHDIPLLNQLIPEPVIAELMKGRSNYLCRQRWGNLLKNKQLKAGLSAEHLAKINDWIDVTHTGDRSELDFLPDSSLLWQEICSRPESCRGGACLYSANCFIIRLKIRAQQADLVVTNHHLFLADTLLRKQNIASPLPDCEAVVFDEGHLLDAIATEFLGVHLSGFAILDFLSRLNVYKKTNLKNPLSRETTDEWVLEGSIRAIKDAVSFYFDSFGKGEGRFLLDGKYNEEISRRALRLHDSLISLKSVFRSEKNIPEESYLEIESQIRSFCESLSFIDAMSETNYVYWGEHTRRGSTLHSNPIDISDEFPGMVTEPDRPLIMTSATLSIKNTFDYICQRLGFKSPGSEIYPSPFNYQQQALLYLPVHLPFPEDSQFYSAVIDEIKKIIRISEGKALILTTSYRGLNEIQRGLTGEIDYTLLVQGQAPKRSLLTTFKNDRHSVLLATASFWQGVDVPGDALSCLIIDKIPFASPGDPIVQARIEYIKIRGGKPFSEFQIPEAVMSLKQGLGRLIRSSSDSGIAVVLDKRIRVRHYGKMFLDSIPNFKITGDLEDVRNFVKNQTSS